MRVDLHPVEAVEEEQEPECDEDHSARKREDAEVVAEPPERRHAADEEDADGEECDAEADRVRGEQGGSARDGRRAARERQRAGEERTYTRSRANGEGASEQDARMRPPRADEQP